MNKMLVVLLCTLLLIACGNNNTKPNTVAVDSGLSSPTKDVNESSLPTPTKDILVIEGDLNKEYTILGQVEAVPNKGKSIYSNQIDANNQAKEFLKKAAFAKYGEKVDAIINYRVLRSIKGGFWGAFVTAYGATNLATQAEGIAVSFKDNEKEVSSTEESQPISTVAKGKSTSRKKRAKAQ